MMPRFGKQAALDLGCLGLDLEVTNATVDCLREKSILALLSMEIVNELMTHPCIGNIENLYGSDSSFLLKTVATRLNHTFHWNQRLP